MRGGQGPCGGLERDPRCHPVAGLHRRSRAMNLQTANMAAATFFQKNLADLVKGIRGHKKNEKEYIQKCLNEIKEEFKSSDCRVKCIAVQKCTYLAMLGYDMEWAAFHVVEVMADQNFQHKRIGMGSRAFNWGGGGDRAPQNCGGGGRGKRAQLTGPLISHYELWCPGRRKIF